MIAIRLIVGLCLLLVGRKLFWVFVAAIGFAAGLHFAMHYLVARSELTVLLIAAGCGLVGALLAIFLQKLAIGVAGFVGGATLAAHVLLHWRTFTHTPRDWMTLHPQGGWIVALVGGVIGAMLMVVFFDWALIILSSLLGAALITELLPVEPALRALIYIGLAITGLVVQAQMGGRRVEE